MSLSRTARRISLAAGLAAALLAIGPGRHPGGSLGQRRCGGGRRGPGQASDRA